MDRPTISEISVTAAPRLRLDGLPPEILDCIVAHIAATPEVPVEHRAWFSTQSLPLPSSRDGTSVEGESTLKKLSRVSKVFRPIAQNHLFRRLFIRFEVSVWEDGNRRLRGFERLDRIAALPHLAGAVQRLTYGVRREYFPDPGHMNAFRNTIHQEGKEKLYAFLSRASEELKIFKSERDIQSLKRAIVAFKGKLQHVRIVRLYDDLDEAALKYIRKYRNHVAQHVQLDWTPVYARALGTLGHAVSIEESAVTKWSLPQLDPDSAKFLKSNWNPMAATLAAELQCLLLVFDRPIDDSNISDRMIEIAPLFRSFFIGAHNMVSIHIGFRDDWVSIPLENVFHKLQLENLKIFSIVGWCLNGDEIIGFVRRHKQRMVGMRLGVLLTDGPLWKDVLWVIRQEMNKLQWLSLFKAGYASDPDTLLRARNAYHDSSSDDDDDSESDNDDDETDHEQHEETEQQDEDLANLGDNDGHQEYHEGETHGFDWASSEGDEQGNEVADDESVTDDASDVDPTAERFTSTLYKSLESSYICTCSDIEHTYTADDLGDNGERVTIEQRKMWERWVIGCQVHGKFDLHDFDRQGN